MKHLTRRPALRYPRKMATALRHIQGVRRFSLVRAVASRPGWLPPFRSSPHVRVRVRAGPFVGAVDVVAFCLLFPL